MPAVHRRRLGAAGFAGAAALAVSLAYFWMEGTPSWLSSDVIPGDLQHPRETSSQAAAARDAPAFFSDSASSSAPAVANLQIAPNEKRQSAEANEIADPGTTAAAPKRGDDAPPERSVSLSRDLGDTLAEGDGLTALGDIASARLYYALASRHGSSEGTRKLAQSYDPLFLQGARVSGLRADVGKAIAGYSAAAALGDKEAATRLDTLLQTAGAEAQYPAP